MQNQLPQHINELPDIRKLFKSYAYPAMINMVVMALYNIVDRIFIGQGAGSLAICGLALTLPYVSLLGTVGTLTGVRCSHPDIRSDLPEKHSFSM